MGGGKILINLDNVWYFFGGSMFVFPTVGVEEPLAFVEVLFIFCWLGLVWFAEF